MELWNWRRVSSPGGDIAFVAIFSALALSAIVVHELGHVFGGFGFGMTWAPRFALDTGFPPL